LTIFDGKLTFFEDNEEIMDELFQKTNREPMHYLLLQYIKLFRCKFSHLI